MAEWVKASLYFYSNKQVRIPVKLNSRSERAACLELRISLRGRSGPCLFLAKKFTLRSERAACF